MQNISEVVVINLDRQIQRWIQMKRELACLTDQEDRPLIERTKRFSAVDAKYDITNSCRSDLTFSYTLGDQLLVEPQPLLASSGINISQRIEMSRQEIAIALSHMAVWKLVANGDCSYVLIVEDDVYFTRDFAPVMDEAWADLVHSVGRPGNIDLLYLSYEEAKGKAEKEHVSEYLFRPRRGLWNLSGYVLSKEGANKLLALLPVYGPVDLWMNHQFDKLSVFATSTSLIEQRRDYQSSNSYSILPVLSKLGVLTEEGPATFEQRKLPGPIIGIGRPGTGLTSLAMALSMLGYRCCSDINELPSTEQRKLFQSGKERVFDAYVNVSSVAVSCIELAKQHPNCRIIITVNDDGELYEAGQDYKNQSGGARSGLVREDDGLSKTAGLINELQRLSVRYLILASTERNKWEVLCQFLKCLPPVGEYPRFPDRQQRRLIGQKSRTGWVGAGFKRLKFDRSPWVASRMGEWRGIPLEEIEIHSSQACTGKGVPERVSDFDCSHWKLLDDTFPSNLALFRPANLSMGNDDCAVLSLRKEKAYVRNYTAASICSRNGYLYGKFEAVIKPAGVPGVITGMFLHRSSPRQEIDIEFLGKDRKRLLVNVYYNPGEEGAKFDYGYRGTPALIELGFDASEDFHRYSIEWCATAIRWFVDGRLVHERVNWGPTPIPHLPMQFYLNIWPSRSRDLTGRLSDEKLPTHSEIKSVELCAWPSP